MNMKKKEKFTTKMPQNADWFIKFLKKIPKPEINGIILSKKFYNKIKKSSIGAEFLYRQALNKK